MVCISHQISKCIVFRSSYGGTCSEAKGGRDTRPWKVVRDSRRWNTLGGPLVGGRKIVPPALLVSGQIKTNLLQWVENEYDSTLKDRGSSIDT